MPRKPHLCGTRGSGNDAIAPIRFEYVEKHLLGVDHLVEPEPARLAHVRDDIVLGREYDVAISPRNDLFVAVRPEVVLGHDALPHPSLVRHRLREADVAAGSRFHFEELSEFGPDVFPAYQI